jgi:hypothetical protein
VTFTCAPPVSTNGRVYHHGAMENGLRRQPSNDICPICLEEAWLGKWWIWMRNSVRQLFVFVRSAKDETLDQGFATPIMWPLRAPKTDSSPLPTLETMTWLYITHMGASKTHKRGAKIDSCWFRLWLNWVSSRIEKKVNNSVTWGSICNWDTTLFLTYFDDMRPCLFVHPPCLLLLVMNKLLSILFAHFHQCCLSTQCLLISAGYIPYFH